MKIQEIEGYRLKKELKDGRSGRIFIGENAIGEKAAIKIITDNDPLMHYWQQQEVYDQILALEHPNVVPVLKHGSHEEGFAYIITRYAENGHLVIGKQNPEQSLEIISQVLSGLDYLHNNSLTHGDVQPKNILFDTNNKARLNDFELASIIRHYSEQDEPASHYSKDYMQSSRLLGHKDYKHPDLTSHEQKSNPRFDLYSTGAVLYELLMKRPRSFIDIKMPSSIYGSKGQALDEIIIRSFKDEKSYDSAEQMRGQVLKAQQLFIDKKAKVQASLFDRHYKSLDQLLKSIKYDTKTHMASLDTYDAMLRQYNSLVGQATPDVPHVKPKMANARARVVKEIENIYDSLLGFDELYVSRDSAGRLLHPKIEEKEWDRVVRANAAKFAKILKVVKKQLPADIYRDFNAKSVPLFK